MKAVLVQRMQVIILMVAVLVMFVDYKSDNVLSNTSLNFGLGSTVAVFLSLFLRDD